MKNALVAFLILLAVHNVIAAGVDIERKTIGGIEFVWIQDDQFPTYDISIYFADGAMSDVIARGGETQVMFSLLDSGTHRYSKEQIADILEYYGVSYGATIVHEYSNFGISGLAKDALPTLKMICHLFKDTTFPKTEINRYKRRSSTYLKNLVTNHGAVAEKAFRRISLDGSLFQYSSDPTLKSLRRISQKHLVQKLDYFNKRVKKRIYISGPKKIWDLKKVFINDCGWNGDTGNYVRSFSKESLQSKKKKGVITLVTVPKSNQAVLRIGTVLTADESGKDGERELVSNILGGGFSSMLFRELRTKRGLIYSAGAVIGKQKYYGRSAIWTSTRNEKIIETLTVIKDILSGVESNGVEDAQFDYAKRNLAGRYHFQFEKKSAFLQKILYFDHLGRKVSEIYDYPEEVAKLRPEALPRIVKSAFPDGQYQIVVVGSKDLAKKLRKLGPVKVVSYKNYL